MGATHSGDCDAKISDRDIEVLRMTRADISVLYKVYSKMLSAKSGKSDGGSSSALTPNEVLEGFETGSTKFNTKIFSLARAPDSKIHFQPFVFYLWNYCTLRDEDLGEICLSLTTFSLQLYSSKSVLFTFSLYDKDNR